MDWKSATDHNTDINILPYVYVPANEWIKRADFSFLRSGMTSGRNCWLVFCLCELINSLVLNICLFLAPKWLCHMTLPCDIAGTTEEECGLISKHVHRQLARCNPLFHFLNVLVPTGFVLVGQKSNTYYESRQIIRPARESNPPTNVVMLRETACGISCLL